LEITDAIQEMVNSQAMGKQWGRSFCFPKKYPLGRGAIRFVLPGFVNSAGQAGNAGGQALQFVFDSDQKISGNSNRKTHITDSL
jgi:hypothetical protein